MKRIIQHLKLNTYNYLFISFILLCISSAVFVPLINGDIALYSIIGKAIFTKGIAPYGYIFDHKPIAIYYIYGIASLIYPFKIGFPCLISVLFSLFIAIVINKFYPKKNGVLINLFIIILLSYFPYRFTGNTELIASLFIILSICNMIKNKNHYLSGICGAIAFNINYLSAVCLLLPTLYYFYKLYKHKNFNSIGKYIIGFLIAFILLLLPIELLNGLGGIYNYYKEQWLFERYYDHAYSGNRIESIIYFLKKILIFILPICFTFIQIKEKKTRLFLFFSLLGSFISTILSGYSFLHYMTFFAVICAFMFIISINKQRISKQKKVIIILIFIPCLCIVINYLKHSFRSNVAYFRSYEYSDFKTSCSTLDKIVNNKPVLSIRTSHTIFYFSHISPSINLVFSNHAYVMSGCDHNKEDDFFIEQIKKSPRFILTNHDLARNSKEIKKTIQLIHKKYHTILISKGLDTFDLYEINN